MKNILKRFTSPIVIIQIISIIGTIVCAVSPEIQGDVEKIIYSLTIIVNVVAGLNNPSDKENF